MKVLKKSSIVLKKKTAEHTRTERQVSFFKLIFAVEFSFNFFFKFSFKVLEAVRECPFLVSLHYAFQTDSKLHLILGKYIFLYIQK